MKKLTLALVTIFFSAQAFAGNNVFNQIGYLLSLNNESTVLLPKSTLLTPLGHHESPDDSKDKDKHHHKCEGVELTDTQKANLKNEVKQLKLNMVDAQGLMKKAMIELKFSYGNDPIVKQDVENATDDFLNALTNVKSTKMSFVNKVALEVVTAEQSHAMLKCMHKMMHIKKMKKLKKMCHKMKDGNHKKKHPKKPDHPEIPDENSPGESE